MTSISSYVLSKHPYITRHARRGLQSYEKALKVLRIRNTLRSVRRYWNPGGGFAPGLGAYDMGKIRQNEARRQAIVQRVREEAMDADVDPFDPRELPEDETPDKQKEESAWRDAGSSRAGSRP